MKKVAIIHDWLTTYAGAEKVLASILEIYPSADVFTLIDFIPTQNRDFLTGHKVRTSFLQSWPWVKKKYRNYLPLMPFAVEQFDVTGYDLIISSSHAVAKGVLTGPNQLHICYCHTPIRYAWDMQHQYLAESGLLKGVMSWITRLVLHKIRLWDSRTANGVDYFIANSNFIKRRILKIYRRESVVIYPPVEVEPTSIRAKKGNFYVTASRMVPYKRIPLIVEAFSRMPDRRLVVIGDGPDMQRCRALAGPNVQLVGYQSDEELKMYLSSAKAFVFAAEEDFGIAPIEAQACGTPVIAFGRGGVLETVRGLDSNKPTGMFYQEQTAESLIAAVNQFELAGAGLISSQVCRENAERFTQQRFKQEFERFVSDRVAEFELLKVEGQA